MDRKKIKIAVLAAASGLLILAAGGKQEGICEGRILPDRRRKRKDCDRGFCGRNTGQR